MLIKEVIGLVISIICIIFLAALIISLWKSNQDKNKLEIVQGQLENLVEQIDAGSGQIEIQNLYGWSISSFPQKIGKKTIIPNYCSNLGWTSCLCICEFKSFLFVGLTDFDKDCDKNGICFSNEYTVMGDTTANIAITNNLISVLVNQTKKTITLKK